MFKKSKSKDIQLENVYLSKEYIQAHVHPWKRYFARIIDYLVLGNVLSLLMSIFYPSLLKMNDALYGVAVVSLWGLIEPFFLSMWGYTPGKFLFNIKLRDLDNKKLNLKSAFSRSSDVCIKGMALGFPFFNLYTLCSSYRALKVNGISNWDKDKFVVTHNKVSIFKKIIIICVIGLSAFLVVIGSWEEVQEKEQYNSTFYSDISNVNKDLPKMIDSETELQKVYFSNNTINYQYRLININEEDIDKSKLYDYMKRKILPESCKDSSITHEDFAAGRSVSYNYFDKNGLSLVNVLIKPDDCQ